MALCCPHYGSEYAREHLCTICRMLSSAAIGGQRALWLAGNPGSGKTFLGDYLASRGWHHIDGDQGNQTEDAGVKERWGKLYQAMTEHQSGKTEISEELWRPYYDFLIQEYNKALESGKNVVLSFALLDVFSEKAFLRSAIPSITFVVIDVDADILMERTLVRNAAILETAGTTEEEVWGREQHNKGFRGLT